MDADLSVGSVPWHAQQVLHPRSPKQQQDYCMQPDFMVRDSPRVEHVSSQQPAASCVITTGSPAGGDVTMHTPTSADSASLLERFLNSPETAKKRANSMQRKLADMLSPLLVGRSGKLPSPRTDSSPVVPSTGQHMSALPAGVSPRTAAALAQSPAPMMISPRVQAPISTTTVQMPSLATMRSDSMTMEMSSDGIRSKKSSAESNLSTLSSSNSVNTLQTSPSVTHAQLVSTVPSTPQNQNNGGKEAPALVTPQLDLLMRAARHCALPPSPRAEPIPGSPPGSGNQTTLLAVSHTLPPRMQRGHWCMDDYIMGQKLYTGYASTVYKAQCKRTGDTVVLKIYTLAAVCDLYKYQIYREVRVHASLDHENVVKLFAAFQEGDRIILVQEFADSADLFSLLHKYGGRMNERVAVQLVLEPFLRVLHYLHSRAIVHRDIKPENILFTSGMVLKLGDFGLAIDLREERAVTRAGTLDYMAPEVLRCPYKSRPEENKDIPGLHYSSRVDSWAVGVLTFELLAGFPPFFDQNRQNTEQHINNKSPEYPTNVSEEARSFISRALSKNSAERPTIYEMLIHPWIDQYRGRRSVRTPTGSSTDPYRSSSQASSLMSSDASVAVATTTPTHAPTAMQMACNKVQQPLRVVPHGSATPASLHMPSVPQMVPGGRLMMPHELSSSLPSVPLNNIQQFASPFAGANLSGLKHHYMTPSRLAPPAMIQAPNHGSAYTMPVNGQRVPSGDAAVFVGAYGKAAPPTQVMARMVNPAANAEVPKPHQQQVLRAYPPAAPTMQPSHQA